MSKVQDRHLFLAGVLASPCLASEFMKSASADEIRQRPTLDINALQFGLGDSGTGCRIFSTSRSAGPASVSNHR